MTSLPGKASRSLLNRKAYRSIQHAVSKTSRVNLISKDENLAYKLSSLQTSDYEVIVDFNVDSKSVNTS